MHELCLKFITLSCQLTFCQPSFPASVFIPLRNRKHHGICGYVAPILDQKGVRARGVSYLNIPYMDDTVDGRNPAPVETYKTNFTQDDSWFVPLIFKVRFCWSLVTKRWRPILKLPSTFAFWRPVIKSRSGVPGCGTASSRHKVDQIMTDMDGA